MIPAAQQQPWDQVEPPWRSRRSGYGPSHAPHTLPLEGQVVPWERGWEIRLPLRAEHVIVEKATVAAERITVRRGQITETVRLNETVAREELRVDVTGDVEPTDHGADLQVRPRP